MCVCVCVVGGGGEEYKCALIMIRPEYYCTAEGADTLCSKVCV